MTAYSSGTSTTYGTSTNYIPITIHKSNYGAGYFIKQKTIIGVQFRDLNDSERKKLQTNKGVVISLVVDESPAFKADLLPGDILNSIDGIQILNSNQFSKLISERKGNEITVQLLRDGRNINAPVKLNP